ncbi:glycosyltransferase family 87 protein [Motilibacter aurantiacus]|uniref:glycosyltransferase family 87 protein n=1 Tax=Motilibacter aurantiacus TaxID=2714955 RepID=UPI00140AD5A7|nr:glycosyltransferase 87 family protein [Motilibacter aurantiacus]NHC47373.1 DUF2029 domain-containing protein [Motilibacter aurantiacus]
MTRAAEDGLVLPSVEDPVVRAASTAIGGPAGRRMLSERRWLTPVRVLLLLAVVTALLAVAGKQHCRAEGWTSSNMYFHACYSDVPALYSGRGMDQGIFPYLDEALPEGVQQVEYPVLTGLLMWLEAKLVPDGVADRATTYFDINLLFAVGFLFATVALTAWTAGRRRPWDAAMVALCPAAALAMTVNWDMLAVALLAGGMWAWARDRPALAGVLIGLGTSAKLYPALLLLPILLLAVRTGRWRPALLAGGTAAFVWLDVNVPFMIANWDGWFRFFKFSQERQEGFSSIWYALQLAGYPVPGLNAVASGLTVLLFAAIAWLALAAPRRPRLAQLTFLVVAAFVLTNKVYSPQFLLWLVPLAALARPRWRDYLVWQAGELVHFVGIWLYLGAYVDADRGLGDKAYIWTIVAHLAGTLWLVAVVVRDILKPADDPVRADGIDDDPGGGTFDKAPDVFALGPAPADAEARPPALTAPR